MSYDDLDRLVGVTAGTAQGGNAVFAYDVLDNIRQLDQGTRTVRHTYNTSNRISAIKDAAGNTLSTYVQDTRGNLVQRITGAVTDTFTFDKANRLKATTINGVSSVYGYDGLGRRMQQAEAGVSSYFFYGQAGQLLFSQDATTRTNHIHLAGSLVAKRLVPFSGTTSIRYQHTDALGSPVAETNETGALAQPRERMTAYGEPADGTWQAGPGFTGHQMDASSKLVYMQQRYYDPVSGTFLSTDPVRTDPGTGAIFNRYNYGSNNPYRFTDPDGRMVRSKIRSILDDEPGRQRIPSPDERFALEDDSNSDDGHPAEGEKDYVVSIESQLRATDGFERCTLICLGDDGSYSNAGIHSDGSQINCNTSSLSCPAGSKAVSDAHGHPPNGIIVFNSADVKADPSLVEGQAINFRRAKVFSDDDKRINREQGINGWLIPERGGKIFYYDEGSDTTTEHDR